MEEFLVHLQFQPDGSIDQICIDKPTADAKPHVVGVGMPADIGDDGPDFSALREIGAKVCAGDLPPDRRVWKSVDEYNQFARAHNAAPENAECPYRYPFNPDTPGVSPFVADTRGS